MLPENLEVRVPYPLVLLVNVCWTHGGLGCEEGNLQKLTLPAYAAEERRLMVTVVGLKFDIFM